MVMWESFMVFSEFSDFIHQWYWQKIIIIDDDDDIKWCQVKINVQIIYLK